MHVGKQYSTIGVLLWTRRNIYRLTVIGLVAVVLYQVLGWHWLALPWTVVSLLGTATAFVIGFRNSQTYSRTWEARQVWGGILNLSRTWGVMTRDFVDNAEASRQLAYRHLAWVTALRYSMREVRAWETMGKSYNDEFRRKWFTVPETETALPDELAAYLDQPELAYVLSTRNKPAQLLSLQSKTLRGLHRSGQLSSDMLLELERLLKDLYDVQGKSERIKNFPYPRQFATINTFCVEIFNLLLPFCMLQEFSHLNAAVSGPMQGHMVWLVVPFSVLISWVFTSLDQVGESTENPFEGSAHDVPISQISRTIEIDLREMLGETALPQPLVPKNHIVL